MKRFCSLTVVLALFYAMEVKDDRQLLPTYFLSYLQNKESRTGFEQFDD